MLGHHGPEESFWSEGDKIFKLYGVSGGDWAARLPEAVLERVSCPVGLAPWPQEWQSDAKLFQLWAHVQTGYPLVDANMRELRGQSQVHFRCILAKTRF